LATDKIKDAIADWQGMRSRIGRGCDRVSVAEQYRVSVAEQYRVSVADAISLFWLYSFWKHSLDIHNENEQKKKHYTNNVSRMKNITIFMTTSLRDLL
jgi:hypothetical protein